MTTPDCITRSLIARLPHRRCGSALLLAGLALASTNCTYGKVTWGGEAKANAYVSISNCDAESWNTYTSASGWYSHDGYVDADEFIPEGLLLIMTRIGGIEKFDMAFQSYEPCPDDPDKLCDRHDVDFGFKPLSGWEWNAWYDWLDTHNTNNIYDFFAFCGAGISDPESENPAVREAMANAGTPSDAPVAAAKRPTVPRQDTAIGRAELLVGETMDGFVSEHAPMLDRDDLKAALNRDSDGTSPHPTARR